MEKKADYNASLLCYTQGGASISTGECAYLVNSASWGNDDDGHTTSNYLPTAGRKCVNTVIVGCDSRNSDSSASSARTINSYFTVDSTQNYFAGRFSIPHLQL